MDDLLQKPTLREKFALYRPYILFFCASVIVLIYVFNLIFGEKSVLVLMELREREAQLQKSVTFYLKQNAALQKEIFELSGE